MKHYFLRDPSYTSVRNIFKELNLVSFSFCKRATTLNKLQASFISLTKLIQVFQITSGKASDNVG